MNFSRLKAMFSYGAGAGAGVVRQAGPTLQNIALGKEAIAATVGVAPFAAAGVGVLLGKRSAPQNDIHTKYMRLMRKLDAKTISMGEGTAPA